MGISECFALFLQYYFVLTPFFVLAVFLALTDGISQKNLNAFAIRTTIAIVAVTDCLFLFGPAIFKVFGVTLDAFRIGSGALLFLSALSLVNGKVSVPNNSGDLNDLAVVPLAIPITVGPGSVGLLIVLSLETHGAMDIALTTGTLTLSAVCIGAMLFFCRAIHRCIGKAGINMLSKLTGLILASLSCQMMFTGAAAFFK